MKSLGNLSSSARQLFQSSVLQIIPCGCFSGCPLFNLNLWFSTKLKTEQTLQPFFSCTLSQKFRFVFLFFDTQVEYTSDKEILTQNILIKILIDKLIFKLKWFWGGICSFETPTEILYESNSLFPNMKQTSLESIIIYKQLL